MKKLASLKNGRQVLWDLNKSRWDAKECVLYWMELDTKTQLSWIESAKWVLVLSHIWFFVIPRTVAHQAPLSMESPGKNSGVGCHSLLQGIFPTQGSNPNLLYCRQILYCLSHQGLVVKFAGSTANWNVKPLVKILLKFQGGDKITQN